MRLVRHAALLALLATAAPTVAQAQDEEQDEPPVVLTAATLDRFAKGLAAEQAERTKSARLLASWNEATYDRCYERVSQEPAYQKFEERGFALSERNPDSEATMRAMDALDREMRAYVRGKCGPSRYELEDGPELAGRAASGLGETAYATLKERVAPFCREGAKVQRSGGGARAGRYVWTAAEADALASRCGALWPALKTLL